MCGRLFATSYLAIAIRTCFLKLDSYRTTYAVIVLEEFKDDCSIRNGIIIHHYMYRLLCNIVNFEYCFIREMVCMLCST